MSETVNVEVVYALPGEQTVLAVRLPAGATASQAIEQSGILARHPEIDLDVNKTGVFGKLVKLDAVLRDGDRVEIYRPLIADPVEMRKRRVAEGKAKKAAGQA